MNADVRFELAKATIAERHHQADLERLVRLARTSRERSDVVTAMASRSPSITVPAPGA